MTTKQSEIVAETDYFLRAIMRCSAGYMPGEDMPTGFISKANVPSYEDYMLTSLRIADREMKSEIICSNGDLYALYSMISEHVRFRRKICLIGPEMDRPSAVIDN